MKKEIKEFKINCKKHGKTQNISFSIDDEKWVKTVCFKCWVEKTTKGLKK